jgi:hypothetical protein
VAQNPEFFVSEQGKSRGPVRLDAVRRELSSGAMSTEALFRMEGCKRFLPGAAWDPISDLFPTPSPPDLPDGATLEALPRDLAGLDPQVRDKMLWFVEDADGVMGPVAGGFVARGLITGRIPMTAAVSLVSVPGWVRATAVFPAALESATAIRARPMQTFPCPYCVEPVIVGSTTCMHCSEPVSIGEPPIGAKRGALLGAIGLSLVLAPLVAGVVSLRKEGGALVRGSDASAASAAALPDPTAAADAREAEASLKGTRAGRRLAGEVAAKIDVAADAQEALLLPHGHVAVARRAALDVVDPKSGVVVTSSREASPVRAIERVGSALYALGPTRIAALDAESLRVTRWIEPRVPIGALAVGEELAAGASTADRSVIVFEAHHHVEIARFRLMDDMPSAVAIDPAGKLAVAAVSEAYGAPPSAIVVFTPSRAPGTQAVRRLAMGEPIAAVAAIGTDALVALGTSSGLVRVVVGESSLLAPSGPARETCSDPAFVRAAAGAVIVGCRAGRAIALHDGASLDKKKQIDLGGPVVALEVAPDGGQALVATGAPAPGVFVVDLGAGESKRVAVTDEVTSVRYGGDGGAATAFAPRARRVWVLR